MLNHSNLRHGIINVGDLPIPFDLVLNAAVLVVVLTFVFLKVSWKESILTSKETLFSTKQSTSGKLFGFLILATTTPFSLCIYDFFALSIYASHEHANPQNVNHQWNVNQRNVSRENVFP